MLEHDVVAMDAELRRLYSLALGLLREPDTADAFAAFVANYRSALEAHGFTREEAVRIVAAHRIPSITSSVAP